MMLRRGRARLSAAGKKRCRSSDPCRVNTATTRAAGSVRGVLRFIKAQLTRGQHRQKQQQQCSPNHASQPGAWITAAAPAGDHLFCIGCLSLPLCLLSVLEGVGSTRLQALVFFLGWVCVTLCVTLFGQEPCTQPAVTAQAHFLLVCISGAIGCSALTRYAYYNCPMLYGATLAAALAAWAITKHLIGEGEGSSSNIDAALSTSSHAISSSSSSTSTSSSCAWHHLAATAAAAAPEDLGVVSLAYDLRSGSTSSTSCSSSSKRTPALPRSVSAPDVTAQQFLEQAAALDLEQLPPVEGADGDAAAAPMMMLQSLSTPLPGSSEAQGLEAAAAAAAGSCGGLLAAEEAATAAAGTVPDACAAVACTAAAAFVILGVAEVAAATGGA